MDISQYTRCSICGHKGRKLTILARYTLKSGEIRVRYKCRECNTARKRAERGTVTPLKEEIVSYQMTKKVYNPYTGTYIEVDT